MTFQVLLLIILAGIFVFSLFFKEKIFPLIPIFFFSVFIGLVVGIFSTETGHIDFKTPYVLTTMLLSFIVMLLFHIKNTQFSECKICKSKGKDNLAINKKKIKLCRKHLLAEYERLFLSFNSYLVVVNPDFEAVNAPYHFLGFSPINELKKINMDKMLENLATRSLLSIKGKCVKCNKSSTVAFYDRQSYKYSNNYPVLEKISSKPNPYCKQCAVELLLLSMENYKKDFTNPVIAPSGTDLGIVFPWIV